MQTFIQPNAIRSSASKAFLRIPRAVPGGGHRGTVRVVTKVHVDRVLIEVIQGVKHSCRCSFPGLEKW
jgi:hypothetical protein